MGEWLYTEIMRLIFFLVFFLGIATNANSELLKITCTGGDYYDDKGNFDTASYQEAVKNGAIPVELNLLLVNWENYLRTWLAD